MSDVSLTPDQLTGLIEALNPGVAADLKVIGAWLGEGVKLGVFDSAEEAGAWFAQRITAEGG